LSEKKNAFRGTGAWEDSFALGLVGKWKRSNRYVKRTSEPVEVACLRLPCGVALYKPFEQRGRG